MKTNWPTKKLGEICQIKTGKKDVNEGNPMGKYPFFSCSRGRTYSDTYSFDTEAILIAGNGDVGNTQIYKGKFEAYQRTYILDKFEGNIKYFYYYLFSNLKKILVRSKSGSTMPYIRKGDLENFELLIPEEKSTQQKIVKILDTVKSVVGVQEKIIEKTKELKKAMMAKLFREGARGAKLKKTEIGEIPENWEIISAQNFCKFVTDGTHDTPKKFETGYYLVTSKNLKNGKLDFNNAYKISKKDFEEVNRRSKVDQFDVIFGMIGTIGSPILVLDKDPSFAIKNVGLFKNGGNYIKGLYLFYYLDSEKSKDFIGENIGRTTQAYITLGLLRKFPIAIPKDKNEQQEIAEILQTIDQKIEIEQKKKTLYEELFRTMLNKIMNQEINIEEIKI